MTTRYTRKWCEDYSTLNELLNWYNDWAAKNGRPPAKPNTLFRRLKRNVPYKKHNSATLFRTIEAKCVLVSNRPNGYKCFSFLLQFTPRPEGYGTVSDILPEANKMRERAGYPPYKDGISLLCHLRKHQCPHIKQVICKHPVRFWHIETALRILYNVNHRCVLGNSYDKSPLKLYATLPAEKLESGIYLPVKVVAKMLHASYNRLSAACTNLRCPCYRHPVTNERVVNMNEAYEYLAYRSAQYLNRKLGKAFDIIKKKVPTKKTASITLYYVPELIEEN